jgi:predicted RNase H-like nuclease (RuvC/YqgF family)
MDVKELFSEPGDPGWIVVYVIAALVVLGALAGAAMVSMRKRRERDQQRAGEIRADVRQRENRMRQRDAEARRLAAESEQARAEADRLEAEAQVKRDVLERERAAREAQVREADELDPRSQGRHEGDR